MFDVHSDSSETARHVVRMKAFVLTSPLPLFARNIYYLYMTT